MQSFNQILAQLLESGSVEAMALINKALKIKPMAKDPEQLAVDLFRLALLEEKGFKIAEFPSYSLKRSVPDNFRPKGMYAKWALKALRNDRGPIEFRDLVRMFPCGDTLEGKHYWAYLQIHRDLSRYVERSGGLKICLQGSASASRRAATKTRRDSATPTVINDTIYEANLEALIAENLDNIELGLQLVGRQYTASPVGRIDLLCRDGKGNLVVIEIKRFGANTDSIVGQIMRYMGWVGERFARPRETVRGIIIVGAVDPKLSYAVKAFRNLEIRCFNLNLEKPE